MAIRHSSDLPAAISAMTGFPLSDINRRLRVLKDDGLISMGRPAPPITSRDLARILIALAAARQSDAARFVRTIGRLPRFHGDGPDTAEDALVDIIDVAVFRRTPSFDLTSGEIAIDQAGQLSIDGRTHALAPMLVQYRSRGQAAAVRTTVRFPIHIIRDVARAVLLKA